MMPLQSACGAESQVRNKSSNGPLRARGKVIRPSIPRRVCMRQLPGVCWYSVKRAAVAAANQGGTADHIDMIRP